jgi:hypothetical protein
MSILSELNTLLGTLDIPIETGIFSEAPPDEYLVITPMSDILDLYADNRQLTQLEEVRLSLFTKSNYINRRNQLTRLLLEAGFSITDCRYIGFEEDTKYHHYCVDVMMVYEMEV